MPELSTAEWDDFIARFPNAHLLQTTHWGTLKSEFGWGVARVAPTLGINARAGAQILFRPLPLGFSLAYIPKGPVGEPADWQTLWPEVDKACRKRKAVFLKVEPDRWEGEPGDEKPKGFRRGFHSIQPARTILVDLRGTEEELLERMKQKTRYNIRLAQKKGVVVHTSTDMEVFHRLMQVTGERDAFGVHSREYYQRAYELFAPQGACELLVAEWEGQPLAALMAFSRGTRAWYFYGASANEHRERMPTYLLQWEAMRWARGRGCLEYDLWGVPDEDEATLEAQFAERNSGLWGVYRFKRGFGGRLVRSSGPWDRIYQPLMYTFYRLWARREE